MKQDYFVYNDRRYNAGDLIPFMFFDGKVGRSYRTQVKFLYYNTDTKEYFIEVYGQEYNYTENMFYRNICNPVVHSTHNVKSKFTFSDELNIDSLLMAWIWYVFIMVVATIFYDRIAIWILASIVFFNYRNKKLKEAGYK